MQAGLLKDSNLETQLDQDGVIKIPFLTTDELTQIKNLYIRYHGEDDPPSMYDGIHMTIWHSDIAYKMEINTELKKILKAACERTFQNYRALSEQFIAKRKGTDTTFPIHQDWSIVDETKHKSFNLWIPLQDVDESNGAMWIVKGSHKIKRKVRGAGYLFPNYYPVLEELKPMMTSFNMHAGEALIFFHNTLHGSPSNKTNSQRVVTQISIVPEDAQLQIYFQKSEADSLEVHHPADAFTFYYDRIREESELRPPTGKPTELLPSLKVYPATLEEVKLALKENVF
jgi:hypothetical protein